MIRSNVIWPHGVLGEWIPKDQVWLLPQNLLNREPGEDFLEWCQRIIDAAERGEVGIIKGLKVEHER